LVRKLEEKKKRIRIKKNFHPPNPYIEVPIIKAPMHPLMDKLFLL
jgi:hypothetical protein